MSEVSSDLENQITLMVKSIDKVDTPKKSMDSSDVPEYQDGAGRKGLVVVIPQAHLGTTQDLPIRTDNLDKCVAGLLRTPLPNGKFKIDLVHIQSGYFEDNAEGAKLEDVRKGISNQTEAIFIHSNRSAATGTGLARQIAYAGATTKKDIDVQAGKSLIDVLYRPDENIILARIKDINQVQIFDGF